MPPNTLCVIPAKGSSQRLPRKNLANLGGRSLLQWSIDSARKANLCSRILVSTEDQEVAKLTEELGVDMPFLRPRELANDPAGVIEVSLHAVEELEKIGETFATLIILLPTCPFRSAADIVAAYELFETMDRPCLMSVSEFNHTPFAAFNCDNKGRLTAIFPQHIGKQSQEMPVAYRPNGAVHVLDMQTFRAKRTYFYEPLVSYIMPRERSIDIDSELDLIMARSLLSLNPELAE